MKYSALLAGGKGTRLQSVTPYKPLAPVNGLPLLEYGIRRLLPVTSEKVFVLLNSRGQNMDFGEVPSLTDSKINYFFSSPPSSFHSLCEVVDQLGEKCREGLLVSMVDTLVSENDFTSFLDFCLTLFKHESAILTTNYVDDENPLTVKCNENGLISELQVPMSQDILVTSGIYYFSGRVLDQLDSFRDAGIFRMRNFLKLIVEKEYPVFSYRVKKTLDIDRPEDLEHARDFFARG